MNFLQIPLEIKDLRTQSHILVKQPLPQREIVQKLNSQLLVEP
jgi:hypothetical protein